MARHTKRRQRQKGGQGLLNRIRGVFRPAAPIQEPQSIGGQIVPLNQTPPSGFSNWNIINNPAPPPGAIVVPPPPTPTPQGVLSQNELEALLATPAVAAAPSAAAPAVVPPQGPQAQAPVTAPTNPVTIAQRNAILTDFIRLLSNNPIIQARLSKNEFANILSTLSYSIPLKKNRTGLYNLVQYIPAFQGSPIEVNIDTIIAQGGFGTIFNHRTDPTRIIKRLTFDPRLQTQNDFLNNSLREVFIQFYLFGIQPGSVPAIYSFAKDEATQPGYFYIEMENLSYPYMDIYAYFNRLNSQGTNITYNIFYHILYNVCSLLHQLELKTSFVHRDFKLNNIMINSRNWEVKIIDFGYTILRIPNIVGGEDYIINNYQPAYQPNATARFQQDMGLFLIFFREYYIERGIVTDRLVHRFIEMIIPPSVRGLAGYINAYNFNGSKYAGANTDAITPIAVINFINDFNTRVIARTIAGGKRSYKRSHKRSYTRSHTKRRSHKK